MMRMKFQDYTFQRAEPAEHSQICQRSRYTLQTACRVQFCCSFARAV